MCLAYQKGQAIKIVKNETKYCYLLESLKIFRFF